MICPEPQAGGAGKLPGLPEELELIEQKMSQLGTANRSLSAKDGAGRLCGEAGIAGAEGACFPLRRSSEQLNQLTRRVHETGRVYDADLEDISQRQEQLWEGLGKSLPSSPNFRNRGINPICGGRNGVLSPRLPPLFFARILAPLPALRRI